MRSKKKITILIVDDHSVVRKGLCALFTSGPEFRIVGEASNGEQAIRLAEKRKPDVAMIDISMPKLNGIETTRVIKERNPDIKVLILTIYDDEEHVSQIIRAGANGYVLKEAGKKELFAAVRAVAADEPFFSPAISRLIVQGFIDKVKTESARATAAEPLTKRETEILCCIAQGLTNREIARELFLSPSTINTHRTNLMKKLDIHDTAGLVRYAIKTGLVEPEQ
jgi:DNA-binding NarL/FixJ family response regulator